MSSGNEIFLTSLLSYTTLIGSIVVIIISIFLLITKGKRLNKHMRILCFILIAISMLIILFLAIMAIGFGNAHPSGSPVPIT